MKFAISYQIFGTTTFEAADAAEAQKKFDKLSIYQLAEIGDLESAEPQLVEVSEAEFQRSQQAVNELPGA